MKKHLALIGTIFLLCGFGLIPIFSETVSADYWIDVYSPSQGTTLCKGNTITIQWTSSGAGSYVNITLYQEGYFYYSISPCTNNDGDFSWLVPSNLPTGSYVIIIWPYDPLDAASGSSGGRNFFISERTISVTSPSSGTTLYQGETKTISWSSNYEGGNVKIELYTGESFVSTISSITANGGSYSWTVPFSLSTGSSYRIKITSTSYSNTLAYSDSFSIDERYVTITSPSSGTTWYQGETKTITWDSKNIGNYVKIELYQSDYYYSTIASEAYNYGSFSWTVPSDLSISYNYHIIILDYYDSNVYAKSGYFNVDEKTITVNSPWSGNNWYEGGINWITWNSKNIGNYVTIELYQSGSYYSTIASSVYNYGSYGSSYSWTIPSDLPTSSSYKIKITDSNDNNVYDYSEDFNIEKTFLQNWSVPIVIIIILLFVVIGMALLHKKKKKNLSASKNFERKRNLAILKGMKPRWKWLFKGYLVTLTISLIFLFIVPAGSYYPPIALIILAAVSPIPNILHIFSMGIGYYIGLKKEGKERKQHLSEDGIGEKSSSFLDSMDDKKMNLSDVLLGAKPEGICCSTEDEQYKLLNRIYSDDPSELQIAIDIMQNMPSSELNSLTNDLLKRGLLQNSSNNDLELTNKSIEFIRSWNNNIKSNMNLRKEEFKLNILKEKIQKWKNQGYNVEELEKMIEEIK